MSRIGSDVCFSFPLISTSSFKISFAALCSSQLISNLVDVSSVDFAECDRRVASVKEMDVFTGDIKN